jgi:hypothetical protein
LSGQLYVLVEPSYVTVNCGDVLIETEQLRQDLVGGSVGIKVAFPENYLEECHSTV